MVTRKRSVKVRSRGVAAAEWDLGAEIDRLYGSSPDEFVAERESLVRRLRAERRRDEAKEVHALRKPSRAAWAINRVAREDPELAADAVAAGEALRDAQLAVGTGGGADALRAAANAQRATVERFARAARDGLAGAGLGEAELLGRVTETLLAAATDPDLAERVGAVRVIREQAPVGFGALAAAPAPLERTRRGRSAARAGDRPGQPEARAAKAADDEARRRAESQARVREARAGEARAHEQAAQLETAFEQAEARRSKAREGLERAQAKADAAEQDAADVEVALAQAQDEALQASALLRQLEADATD